LSIKLEKLILLILKLTILSQSDLHPFGLHLFFDFHFREIHSLVVQFSKIKSFIFVYALFQRRLL
ncbi:hypothetical protein, partial [Paenibacillus anaericanus]|uniref:hypothetical protein n=1 Tax=Paenibacillus anaericanus TaxID=170367 RepID=UPI0027D7B6DA